jgi:ATP adenylyltransferase
MYKNYLWAVSRMKYVKMEKGGKCLFCRIAEDDPNVEKRVIYKDKDFMVIMNMFPYNVGHLEVVPIRHVVELTDLDEREFNKMFDFLKKSVELLKKALNPKGFNVGINLGNIAGASIEHLHIHVVPRYERDAGFMEIVADTKVMPESIDQTFKKLKKYADIFKK